jgi:SulP family sulfate permease
VKFTPGALARPVTGWWSKNKPADKAELGSEAVAGLPGAIGSVPDGMAASVLTGVSPIHGLYASFAGPLVGGLSSSTKLMVVTTTSAAALAAGSALQSLSPEERPEALFLLTALAGVFMLLAGIFRLGKYTRFVSHSVMTGFLTGVAANIVLSQLGDLTGYQAEGDISLEKAIDVLRHPGEWSMATLACGIGALVIVIALSRTKLSGYGALLALIVPTVLLEIFDVEGVFRVDDVGEIPTGLPLPHIPQLSSLTFSVVTGALAVAAIVLVQGAGVSEASPNLDGSRSNSNQDFIAQGAGNIAAGFFKGQPVGGSVSQTALNSSAGARTRWAAIFSGLWMLLILVAFSGVVGVIAMTCLAAVLIYAAVSSIRPHQIATVWSSGLNSQIAIVTTFTATIFLPIAAAVGLGVAISLLLQLNQGLVDLRVVELRRRDDGLFEEHDSPAHTTSREVTVLDVYGSLLYAGARSLQSQLPDPTGTESPVVVLRLRGRLSFGATFAVVMSDYVERLAHVGGHLILSGVEASLMDQLRTSGGDDIEQHVSVYEASSVIGESTLEAVEAGERWLADQSDEG